MPFLRSVGVIDFVFTPISNYAAPTFLEVVDEQVSSKKSIYQRARKDAEFAKVCRTATL